MSWFSFSTNDFAYSFLSVLFEGVPFLLLGSLISGLVDVFVSSERMQKLMPRNPAAAIAMSGLLGLIFPMCECGSVIVIRRFIKKGLPLSSAVTYMLASPIVSPLVALSTFAAFKGQNPWLMTSLRLSIGYMVAMAVGFIVLRLRPSTILQPSALAMPNTSRRAGVKFSATPGDGQQDFSQVVAQASFPKKLLLSVQSATADFLGRGLFPDHRLGARGDLQYGGEAGGHPAAGDESAAGHREHDGPRGSHRAVQHDGRVHRGELHDVPVCREAGFSALRPGLRLEAFLALRRAF